MFAKRMLLRSGFFRCMGEFGYLKTCTRNKNYSWHLFKIGSFCIYKKGVEKYSLRSLLLIRYIFTIEIITFDSSKRTGIFFKFTQKGVDTVTRLCVLSTHQRSSSTPHPHRPHPQPHLP